jgi:hypothetical protein
MVIACASCAGKVSETYQTMWEMAKMFGDAPTAAGGRSNTRSGVAGIEPAVSAEPLIPECLKFQ